LFPQACKMKRDEYVDYEQQLDISLSKEKKEEEKNDSHDLIN